MAELPPWLASLLRIGGGVGIGYVLLVGVIYVAQNALIYLPRKLSAPAAARLASERDLKPWPADGARGYLRQPAGAARGTVVVFHGNAGTALDSEHFADALVPLGYRVVLAEYPGYGERDGRPGQASLAADAVATLIAARRDFPGPLVAWGESLGTGVVAAALSGQPQLVDGVVLLNPWDRLVELASHHYPYLPVRWLLRDRYDQVEALAGLPGPTVVLLCGADRTIPPQFGRRLFDSLRGRKHLHVFPAADHNDWPADPSAPWWREVMRQALPGA